MKIHLNFTYLFIIVCFFSCNGISESSIIGKWNFEKIRNSETQVMTDFADKMAGGSFFDGMQASLYPYDYIEFHKDHTFSHVLLTRAGNYISGQWTLNSKDSIVTLHYIDAKNQPQALAIKVLKASSDDGLITRESNKITTYYTKDELFMDNDSSSYTTKDLNSWRNRPLLPESESDIAKRAKASLAFEIAYLKKESKLKNNPMLMKEAIIPIKLGDATIMMLNTSNVSSSWKEVFYDSAQAMHGYMVIKKAFIAANPSYAQIEDPIFTDIQLLGQVLDKIK